MSAIVNLYVTPSLADAKGWDVRTTIHYCKALGTAITVVARPGADLPEGPRPSDLQGKVKS